MKVCGREKEYKGAVVGLLGGITGLSPDAGDLPKRKETTIKTRRKFQIRFISFSEIKKPFLICIYLTLTPRFCGQGSVVSTVTGYRLDGPGIESRWEARFFAPVQTGPGAHPASCTMGTGSFPGVKSGRGVALTPHPLLVPWSRKGRAIPLLPLWAMRPVQSLSACTRVTFTFTFIPRFSIIVSKLPKSSEVLPVSLILSLHPSSSCKNPINSRSKERMGCDATRSRKF